MAESTGKKNRGVALVEILVAFAVFALGMTAVMLVVFGGQSFALDSKLTQRALYHAERGIEMAYASSTVDFHSLTAGILPLNLSGDDAIYGDKVDLDVSNISECVKKVKSRVSWNQEQRPRFAELVSTFVSTSTSAALGGDCVTEEISDDWSNPEAFDAASLDFKKATDVSVVKNSGNQFAVLTTEASGVSATVWVVNVNNPENPFVTDSYDTGHNMSAVTTVNIDGQSYAFAVGEDVTSQLQVFDISDAESIARIATSSLPNITNGRARSVFYYDNKVYVGTQFVICNNCEPHRNNELHVFDVSNPHNPQWQGSFKVNRHVNDIAVRNGVAYIANGPGGSNDSLRVYDVSTPGSISQKGSFTVTHAQQGTSVTILGDELYFGLERISPMNQDMSTFYILDISDPENPIELGSKDLGIGSNDEVKGIEVVGNLAFIATSDQTPANGGGPFMVYDISNPEDMVLVSTCGINFSERATGLDFADNMAFMSKETPAGDGGLIIIHPSPVCN